MDVNDAINHPLASNSPVIVFDPSAYVLKQARKTTMAEITKSKFTTIGRYALGVYNK